MTTHEEQPARPFIIGIAGGTSSGKSTICQIIIERLKRSQPDHIYHQVQVINLESFYKELTEEEREAAQSGKYNFDHPNAFDFDLMNTTLDRLLKGEIVAIPEYDLITSRRLSELQTIMPSGVILIQGILVLYNEDIREKLSMKIFVDEDSDTRLSRRVLRDVLERGRSFDWTIDQYLKFVKPSFDEYILPTKKYSDIVFPRGEENAIGLALIEQHINELVDIRKHSGQYKAKKTNSQAFHSSYSNILGRASSIHIHSEDPFEPIPE